MRCRADQLLAGEHGHWFTFQVDVGSLAPDPGIGRVLMVVGPSPRDSTGAGPGRV